ncbi:MAG: hypothetical protein M5U12_11510 [Verrucomicrobia bacterium]|nr:hypothetical protein [Verrucomicrobiota bacterium]
MTIQAADADMRPILRYQAPTNGTGRFWGPSWESTMLNLTEALGRFEARNLVLDANWSAWATNRTCASAAYTGGSRSAP